MKKLIRSAVLLSLLAILISGMLHVRRHFIDYPVYELAANKVIDGNIDQLYDRERASPGGFYYSYFFALAFTPFAYLGTANGKICFFLLFLVAYIKILDFSTRSAMRTLDPEERGEAQPIVTLLTILLTAYAVNDAFMDANIGILLLLLSVCAYEQRERRPEFAGLLLGTAIALKIYPVVVLGYFIWERRPKVVVSTLVTLVMLYFVLPTAIYGWDRGLKLIADQWYVVGHFGEHWSFDSAKFQNFPSSFIRFAGVFGMPKAVAFRVAVGLITIGTVLFYLKSFLGANRTAGFRERMFVLCLALVPIAVPVSWYNMGLFYAPLIAWTIVRGVAKKKVIPFAALMIYAVLYCLTTPDLVGRDFNHLIEKLALPFLGAAVLTAEFAANIFRIYPDQFFSRTKMRVRANVTH